MAFTLSANAAATRKNEVGQKLLELLKQFSLLIWSKNVLQKM